MASGTIATVFFDLGDTPGTPVLSPPPSHLVGFNVFPFAPSVLGTTRRCSTSSTSATTCTIS